MKKKLKLILCFMVLFLVLPLFTAFAGGGTEQEEIVLKWPCIWVGKDSKAPAVAALVDEFNKANEGKIKVEIEPQPDYDGYEQKIRTSIAAGVVPDIFTLKLNPTTAVYYESDLLLDFNDVLDSEWNALFNTGTLEQSTINGKLKSLPYEVAITPVWYNMDLLKQAGVNSIPATSEEFKEAVAKLKAAGIVPTSQMTGGTNAWTSMLWYSHILASLGGPDVYSKPLTDPVYIQAAEILKMLYTDGNTTLDAVGGDAGVSGGHYLAGDTAMFINGPWYIGRVKDEAPGIYAATIVDSAPAFGSYSDAQIGFLQANFAAVNTDDPLKKEAIIKFLRWMMLPENVARISAEAGSLFAIKYDAGSIDDPLQKNFIEVNNNAAFIIMHLEGAFGAEVVAAFGQALGSLALGDSTPLEFVKALQDANR